MQCLFSYNQQTSRGHTGGGDFFVVFCSFPRLPPAVLACLFFYHEKGSAALSQQLDLYVFLRRDEKKVLALSLQTTGTLFLQVSSSLIIYDTPFVSSLLSPWRLL